MSQSGECSTPLLQQPSQIADVGKRTSRRYQEAVSIDASAWRQYSTSA